MIFLLGLDLYALLFQLDPDATGSTWHSILLFAQYPSRHSQLPHLLPHFGERKTGRAAHLSDQVLPQRDLFNLSLSIYPTKEHAFFCLSPFDMAGLQVKGAMGRVLLNLRLFFSSPLTLSVSLHAHVLRSSHGLAFCFFLLPSLVTLTLMLMLMLMIESLLPLFTGRQLTLLPGPSLRSTGFGIQGLPFKDHLIYFG